MTTDHAIEVKKDGLRQVQDGTWKLSLTIHPNDVPTALLTAPMGTRYGMALVEIADDETRTPVADKSARKPATTRAEKARRLCGVPSFQWFALHKRGMPNWASPDQDKYAFTSDWVKDWCDVGSKSELDPPLGVNILNHGPAQAWDALLSEYEQSTGRMAERHG